MVRVMEGTNMFVHVMLHRIYLKYSDIKTGTQCNNLRQCKQYTNGWPVWTPSERGMSPVGLRSN